MVTQFNRTGNMEGKIATSFLEKLFDVTKGCFVKVFRKQLGMWV